MLLNLIYVFCLFLFLQFLLFLILYLGVSTLVSGVSYIANRFTTYLFFIEDLLFIPHSLTVLYVNGILFLIGLYQLAWVYSVMAKILNFGRNNVVKG